PEQIDYVNAHGTGTPNNDESEGKALMRVFGADNVPPVSSTKSFTGHTTSAAGSVESVISILAMLNDFLPVNLNFKNPMEMLSFRPVTDEKPLRPIRHVMTNSFGFGGNDTTCIFSKI
ncbi:MAG TPA: beta-ketoacyl-[acyl-carrier-protein] synthase family protein, partial [Bacteroidales bacterium]|nr:beta-ketoacyl-[acyl-carrier-protein] synthase family protein [Bacteroidales bacterium]